MEVNFAKKYDKFQPYMLEQEIYLCGCHAFISTSHKTYMPLLHTLQYLIPPSLLFAASRTTRATRGSPGGAVQHSGLLRHATWLGQWLLML